MSSHQFTEAGIEETGLLRSTSFEIDDVEASKPLNTSSPYYSPDVRRLQISLKALLSWFRPKSIFICSVLICGLIIAGALLFKKPTVIIARKIFNSIKLPSPNGEKWSKPADFKIIALIFFGRPSVVAILDCYLKKNLVSNGGFVDEVHWVVNTENSEDINYLDKLVETSEGYKKITVPKLGYNSIWEHAVEAPHMYIKIDDDMVYMSDDAIPNVVYTKLNHPNSLNVVANLINSPETGWLHYRLGALHAYLPETSPPKPDANGTSYGPKAWRASALPVWNEEGEMAFPLADKSDDNGKVLTPDQPGAPPFKGHRWLPLPDDEKNIYKTPVDKTEYNAFGNDWKKWAIAAQVHYSFLENLETNQLGKYHFGTGLDDKREGIWNMNYERMNINFMAIWGKDVVDNVPFEDRDDEHVLSVALPLKLRRPLLVNTHAIAAHFSFRTQHEVYDTDLLDRYRAYANEMVCKEDNQIPMPG